jgi:hypothetical protein
MKLLQLLATLTPGRALTIMTVLNLLMVHHVRRLQRTVVNPSARYTSELIYLWAAGTLSVLLWVACIIILHSYHLD